MNTPGIDEEYIEAFKKPMANLILPPENLPSAQYQLLFVEGLDEIRCQLTESK